MPHRYFTNDINGDTAALHEADAHHLARVMRGKVGDVVELCDGAGKEYTATVTEITPDTVYFSLADGHPSVAEPSCAVTVYVGYPKQDKLDDIIRHAVELGATEIVPFFSRYCVAAPKKEEQKNQRYNRIAVEAAKQCGRGVLPKVVMPLPNFKAVCGELANYDKALFFYECGGQPLPALLAGVHEGKIALITGAEGGFAPEEADLATQSGAIAVGLGPRILRCETAPLAALSAVMTLTGNLE